MPYTPLVHTFVYMEGTPGVKLYRIGDKVLSREKLLDVADGILSDRERGATQEEAAHHAGVQRSFVSFLETIAEVRRGPRIALVGFPVANVAEVTSIAEKYAVDFVLVVSQAQRESIESGSSANVFNQLLETMAVLRDFDTLILLASDWRIRTIEQILGLEVVGIPLGTSPLREDVVVDIAELEKVLEAVMSARRGRRAKHGAVGRALRDAAELARGWTPSRK